MFTTVTRKLRVKVTKLHPTTKKATTTTTTK